MWFAELVGDVLLVVHEFIDFARDTPVEAFDLRAGLEVDDAVAEKIERLLAGLFGVVPIFQHGAGREFVPYFREVAHQLVVVFRSFEVFVHLRYAYALKHVEDKDGVVGRQRAAALGNNGGVRNVVLVRGVDKGVDAVVDVLLDGIVGGTARIGGAGAVVVDAEAAAAVDELDVEAESVELDVELGRFAQGVGDDADFGDLTADMEVDKFKAVLHVHGFELAQRL